MVYWLDICNLSEKIRKTEKADKTAKEETPAEEAINEDGSEGDFESEIIFNVGGLPQ